ncbi:MAG: CDP-paratose 2-epimerase [Cellvibrionaceae bacterium]|jgi:CDP-paratose 2-epimerase
MHILITGGAGFIGSNTTEFFLQQGAKITIFDNFSRPGAAANLAWLQTLPQNKNLTVIKGDIRDSSALDKAVVGADVIIHLAGQVAVTTSIHNPREDFEINAMGTFNLLEAIRNHAPEAILINASTNKVYGGMEQIVIEEGETRYTYRDYPNGIPETFSLDFHSPYGCSKGAADQYVIDYARIYGLKTVTLRQSCIYGPRQFGVEDQGWVAHFIIAILKGKNLTIYGDGKQVRDILHIKDLVRAYALVIDNINQVSGTALNIGGGPTNTMSIWAEFGPLLEALHEEKIPINRMDWRPGDQKVFVADIQAAREKLNWAPAVSVTEGVSSLFHWVSSNQNLF